MAGFKDLDFNERRAAAQQAKEKALAKLKARPPVDEAELARRRAEREARDAARDEARRAKKEARLKAEEAAKAAAEAEAASRAQAVQAPEEERKAARDGKNGAREWRGK